MTQWPSVKSRQIFSALLRIGWTVRRQRGSHIVLARDGWTEYIWAFHNSEEIGPRMLARIAKKTGLAPEDL